MYEVNRTPEQEAEALTASAEFAAYVERLAAQRVSGTSGDLLSDLVAVRDGGDRLSTHELVATAVLLLNAGHEASVNGFGNGRPRSSHRAPNPEPQSPSSRRCSATTRRFTSSSEPRPET